MSAATVSVRLTVTVEYDYQPAEPPERGPEAQYPGCAESVEITEVWLNGLRIDGHLKHEDFAELAVAVLEARDTDEPDWEDAP